MIETFNEDDFLESFSDFLFGARTSIAFFLKVYEAKEILAETVLENFSQDADRFLTSLSSLEFFKGLMNADILSASDAGEFVPLGYSKSIEFEALGWFSGQYLAMSMLDAILIHSQTDLVEFIDRLKGTYPRQSLSRVKRDVAIAKSEKITSNVIAFDRKIDSDGRENRVMSSKNRFAIPYYKGDTTFVVHSADSLPPGHAGGLIIMYLKFGRREKIEFHDVPSLFSAILDCAAQILGFRVCRGDMMSFG